MKFKKTTLFIALLSSLALTACSDNATETAKIDISNAENFNKEYNKLILLEKEMYSSQGYGDTTHTIKNFKGNTNTSTFDEAFNLNLAPNVTFGINSQFNATHTKLETKLTGPTKIFFNIADKVFEIAGATTASFNNQAIYTGNTVFKDLKSEIENSPITLKEMNINVNATANAELSKFENITANITASDFKLSDHNNKKNQMMIKGTELKSDIKSTDFKGLYSSSTNMLISGISVSDNRAGSEVINAVTIDSIDISSSVNVSDKLFESKMALSINNPKSNFNNQDINWGNSVIDISIKGMDAAAYSKFQSNIQKIENPQEIVAALTEILTANMEVEVSIHNTVADGKASAQLSFKPTQALIDLIKSGEKIKPSLQDIEKYVESFNLTMTLPKASFITQGSNVAKIQNSFNAESTVKNLDTMFTQAPMMLSMFVPKKLQSIVKFENDTAIVNLSYKDKIVEINGNKMSVADVLKEFGL